MMMAQQESLKQSYTEINEPAQVSRSHETTGIDKDANYGRYQRPTESLAKLFVKDRQWKSQLGKQVAHKALDEPFLGEDDDMKIDVNNSRTTTGIGWKELAVIGVLVLGTGGAGAGMMALLSGEKEIPVETVTPSVDPPVANTGVNSDTMFIPKIRFGPDTPGTD